MAIYRGAGGASDTTDQTTITTVTQKAAEAATSASNAASSASSASTSASNANSYKEAAATSATNAASSATTATQKASEATSAATQAVAAQTAAEIAEANVASAESNAILYGNMANTAAGDAIDAKNSAVSSASAAQSAYADTLLIKNDAAASATAADTSEANAASSAAAAAASATASANSATDSANYASQALSYLNAIEGTYLGALASDPIVDGNGDPVTVGDWYFNTTSNNTLTYNGTSWQVVNPDIVADTTPQLGGNLDTNGNDVLFKDNDKAIFGDGSDLQIYHDGWHSVIKDAGTGDLKLQGRNFIVLEDTDDTNYLTAQSGAGVVSYYAGSPKLATTSTGIDVTGTATMDGLTVDGNTVFAGGSLGAAGNSQSSIASGLSAGRLVSDAGTDNITAWNTTFNDDVIEISAGATASYVSGIAITPRTTTADAGEGVTLYRRSVPALKVHGSTGDISFYEDTGTTAKFFWDASAESLGIGTSSPSNYAGYSTLTLNNATTGGVYEITQAGTVKAQFFYDGANVRLRSGGAFPVVFDTDNTERMRIDSSGNVGIGTSSPANALQVGGEGVIRIRPSADNSQAALYFNDTTTGGSSYRADMGIVNDGGLYFSTTGTLNTVPTERMRIDSSGNLLVGKTTTGLGTAGVELYGSGSGATGATVITRSGDAPLQLNRLSSDGVIQRFYKDGSTVGSISVTGSSTAYNTSSDYRLKEDWQPVANAITDVKALKPVNFAWKADGTRVNGFLAHELAEVVPEAVTGEKDAVDDEGNPVYQGIDQSKLVPLLTAALQEAIAKIETLEQRLTDAGL